MAPSEIMDKSAETKGRKRPVSTEAHLALPVLDMEGAYKNQENKSNLTGQRRRKELKPGENTPVFLF